MINVLVKVAVLSVGILQIAFGAWLDRLWDILEPLNAPPRVRRMRSRLINLFRRYEARRMVKALRS